MTTRVVSSRIPYLPVTVEIPELRLVVDVEALVDTGFNAGVVLPPNMLTDGPPPLFYGDVRLADGSRVPAPSYLGNVRIGDASLGPILVMVMGDEPIVGLSVITQFRLTIDHDQALIVET